MRLACFSPTTFSHGTKTYPSTLLVLFEGWVVLDTIIATSLFNSTICTIWRRVLSICTIFFFNFKFCSMAQSMDTKLVYCILFKSRGWGFSCAVGGGAVPPSRFDRDARRRGSMLLQTQGCVIWQRVTAGQVGPRDLTCHYHFNCGATTGVSLRDSWPPPYRCLSQCSTM